MSLRGRFNTPGRIYVLLHEGKLCRRGLRAREWKKIKESALGNLVSYSDYSNLNNEKVNAHQLWWPPMITCNRALRQVFHSRHRT